MQAGKLVIGVVHTDGPASRPKIKCQVTGANIEINRVISRTVSLSKLELLVVVLVVPLV